jgi:hypothetical protein
MFYSLLSSHDWLRLGSFLLQIPSKQLAVSVGIFVRQRIIVPHIYLEFPTC